jgi:hypothetical protein
MATQGIDSTQIMGFILKIFIWEQKDTNLPPFIWNEINTYQPFLIYRHQALEDKYSKETIEGIKANYCLIYSYFCQKYPGITNPLGQNAFATTFENNLSFAKYLIKEDSEKAFLLAYDSLGKASDAMHLFYFLYKRIKKKVPFKHLSQQEKTHLICDHLSVIQELDFIYQNRFRK